MPSASYHRSISAPQPARCSHHHCTAPVSRAHGMPTRPSPRPPAHTACGAARVAQAYGKPLPAPKLPTASMPLIGVISAAEATVMPSVVFTAPYGSDRHSSRAFRLLWLSFGRAGGQLPQRSGEEAGPGPRGRAR